MALIGGLFGGGLGGGGLGFLQLGVGLLLKWLFPQKIKGPRADNLKVQTSRFGDPIGRVHGKSRLAGACVWLHNDEITEVKDTSRQGKALGPEVTEFTYFFTGAVKFAWNGPFAAIPRIWADDKLIYDQSAETLTEIMAGDKDKNEIGVVGGAKVTVYLGTDTQAPDPDWQADKGLDATPALRGYAYVVIKDLSLEEFGVRIPNFEAEVVSAVADVFFSDPLDSAVTKTDNIWSVDTNAGLITNVRRSAVAPNSLTVWRVPAMERTIETTVAYEHAEGALIDDHGYVFTAELISPRNLHIYDGYSGFLTQTITGLVAAGSNAFMGANITIDGVSHVFIWWGQRIYLLRGTSGFYNLVWTFDPGYDVSGANNPVTISVSDENIYATINNNNKEVLLIPWSEIGAGTVSVVTLSALDTDIHAVHYDAESDSVIVLGTGGGIWVYDAELSTVLRSKTAAASDWSHLSRDRLASLRLKSASDQIAFMGVRNGANNDPFMLEYRVSDLAELADTDARAAGYDGVGTSTQPTFFSGMELRSRCMVIGVTNEAGHVGPAAWFLPRQQSEKVTLASVIAAECALVGLDNDVTAITGDVYGIGVRDGASPRGVIEDLQQVKFFDFAHVDGTTKFFMRDATIDATIALIEMGHAVPGSEQPWEAEEDYPDSHDLPLHVAMKYVAAGADYRRGTQYSSPPDSFDDNRATFEIETSLVMDDDEAAQSADILWTEILETASRFKTRLGPKYLRLHPGDLISLPLDANRSVTAVLDRQAGEHILECELRAREFDYISTAVGAITPSHPNTLLGRAETAIFLPVDGHLLRAADDDDSFYMGVYPRDGTLTSSAVFRSTDGGATWTLWAGFGAGLAIGLAQAALPDRPHPQSWDRATTFTVVGISGAFPGSTTEAAMLADQTINVFAVASAGGEWEYIRAAIIADNGDGTWTLSTLLRGQHGTEFAMAGHAVGDRVFHVDAATLARAADADRTLERKYVAVTSSGGISDAFAVTFTNTGRGLRPWSPIGLDGYRTASGGDWELNWNRRDRVPQSGSAIMTSGLILNEDSESYDVRLYDGGGTLVNTYAATTEAFTYTTAQQTTDFGSAQAGITVGVVQKSVVFGAGIEERVTL